MSKPALPEGQWRADSDRELAELQDDTVKKVMKRLPEMKKLQ